MLSLEILTLILVTIINALVVWVVASQGWKIVVNRYFILAATFVIFWAIGTLLFMVGSSQEIAHIGITLFYVAPMFVILFLALFSAVFPANSGVALTIPNAFLGLLTLFFAGVITYDPHLLTLSIELHKNGYNILNVQPYWYSVYTLYYSTAFSITFTSFFLQIRRNNGSQRKQLEYIFGGTFLAAFFSLITNLVLPIFGVSQYIWLGPTWTLFYVITVSISIVRHQLFDIKLAAVRSIAYIAVLATLSGIYYLIAYILSVVILGTQTTGDISVSPVNIVLALLLAFLFQPIKHFFDRLTNSIFYRDQYNSDEFFASLSSLLASTTDLRGILERASNEIALTLKAEQAFFFLYYTNDVDHHMSAGTRGHSRLPLQDARALDEYVVKGSDEVIITEPLPDDSDIKRLLISHKIALLMPLKRGSHVIGYVCLGEPRSRSYTKRDQKVLTTIADELVIAIQNALSVHEVKEINATLKQRIHVATQELRTSNARLRHIDATKDEFVSMASHQLRTPLTSVKGYISMVMEGDAGKITDPQRYLLAEAFESSERMVRLINDFLNVSRLQTGKFVIDKHEIDIGKVVGQEVDSLRAIASSHGLRLTYVAPKNPVLIWCDEDKIRQVMMNFIDNAVYYSRRDTTIHIALGQIDDEVIFTVEDTGIGVPVEEQAHLFGKFYRASNARKQRPDGTGVGLFLTKKVITAHQGHVIFSSIEGQGSVFGFRLPLKVNQTDDTDDQHDSDK